MSERELNELVREGWLCRRERYTPAHIGLAYRLRWQAELLFKEWKSYANLHAFDTAKAGIASGLADPSSLPRWRSGFRGVSTPAARAPYGRRTEMLRAAA